VSEAEGVSGKVYFVGAGPGDPDLLTRRAFELLSSADVVLHDALVPPEIVALAATDALVRNVGKRCGKRSVTQQELNALLLRYASEGRTVIRLQGGDPLIFGRAGEEIEALQKAGIDFEIVPGVTAASAAAASARISLTRRGIASKVIFLSAHRCSAGDLSDWQSLPASDVTLAVYMPGGNYGEISRRLQHAGFAADTPCVIVSQAGATQQSVQDTDLASLSCLEGAPSPALLIVGEVTRVQALEFAGSALERKSNG
jgi:uroporphyrin-III C-methyltransferase